MPIVESSFRPPLLLWNGHVQTILGALLPRHMESVFEPERLELPDGDFLDLGWTRRGRRRLAILSHGLEGCSDEAYMRGMSAAVDEAGWDVLAWNFRGCGSEANRLLRFYHSGETSDLNHVVSHALTREYEQLALIGFSLGGNLTLKYLGEAPPHPAVVAAAAISAPIDLAGSALTLDRRWENRIYLRRFLKTLIAKVEAKALRYPEELDVKGTREIRSFLQFDDRFTAPLHGFRDAFDYWTRSSAKQFLNDVRVPTLLLSARNDPFLTPECFPFAEAEQNPSLHLETPSSGGHLGFIDGKLANFRWSERRVVAFLGEVQG